MRSVPPKIFRRFPINAAQMLTPLVLKSYNQTLYVGLVLFITLAYIGGTMKTQAPIWATQIKALRLKLGETQAQFGDRFKVSQVAVSLWESGENEPPAMVFMFLMEQQND